ncbi:choline kinase family protein [uncultured Microbulbifer sp.]|uniref:choline kinase family protein n=1 Tax=uncultured Microbulbifer sp. TaxID=348147 RepID=UPI00260C7AF4|nr:choline kinase family protein [uncultured Microbulbifer sp.]
MPSSWDPTDGALSPSTVIPSDWRLWSESRPLFVRPMTGGLTNRTYLISSGEALLVLRHNSPLSQSLDLDRATEAQVLDRATHAGLCAPLVYCDPQHEYLVTRFIQGQPWHKQRPGAIERLARLLNRIHALPPVNSQLGIEQKAENYWPSISTQADFYSLLARLRSALSSSIRTVEDYREGSCLCHNDLTKENLIESTDEKLIAIDWEYASMGDHYYDLAALVEEHQLSPVQQQQLLSSYLQRPLNRDDWRRLLHWRLIYKYLCVLWHAVQWSTKKDRTDPGAINTQCQTLLQLIPLSH